MSHKLLTRVALFVAALGIMWAGGSGLAQTRTSDSTSRTKTVVDAAGRTHTRVLPISKEERQAAAARLQLLREARVKTAEALITTTTPEGKALAAATAAVALATNPLDGKLLVGANGQLIPDYSGLTPNYANSPMPVFDAAGAYLPGTGIRKFMDGLPGLGVGAKNNLNQYIPVAVPDKATYPGSDYYEIELGEYNEQLHRDLPATRLRGYRQTNTADTSVSVFHYLGPLIVAQRGRPVRIKFTNNLAIGAGGNLFLPVDSSIMGSGPGPAAPAGTADIVCKKVNDVVPNGCYTENRATVHLHGGVTPWISDGTTHQWITPAGETTAYPNGVSVFNVPDMPNPGKPGSATNPSGSGVQTFYYTNDQSARLMFYHDHAMGITRLNVYAGEAAGYLLTDTVEQDLITRGIIPADQIPLVIQDKTFVDATTIRQQDPTWNWGTDPTFTSYTDPRGNTMQLRNARTGDLWWPHVYMPAQNPYDISGLNAMGRWHYGPWFWPPTAIPFGPVANPYYDCNALGLPDPTHPCTMPWQPLEVPGTPQPSWGAEAFLDTPVVNGTAYPTLNVQAKPYRFRILNAAHDRFWNLQLYVADSTVVSVDGRTNTEVKMVPASPATPGLPPNWPMDGREGGVPDPATIGPSFVQIGTEGGFLPMPVVVPNQPIAWNLDPTTFNFGNVSDHALLLGPAERADVIIDFSAYAGKTLILYNDAPAAFPALDARNDYFTGNPDLTEIGGAPSTIAGFGPNVRTIMQITVGASGGVPFNVAALMAEFAPGTDAAGNPRFGVFQRGQDPIIVGQTAYNTAYNTIFPAYYPSWGLARIQDSSMSFQTPQGNFATMKFEPKAIHDEMGATFDDYGRMSAKLGLELPAPNALNQNFVMQGYADPPTELVRLSKIGTPIGEPLADGTQIWKITHNGVDTHPVHFHLFHVQLINRVGWDGAIRLPDETELGWKDTLRISPLEDTIVALRPIAPDPAALPFKLPNSIRPLNPTIPLGSSMGFTGLDPLGNNVTVFNQMVNFGWEYVWHCHILSHEENDMMRSIVFAVPPETPLNLTAAVVGTNASRRTVLTWIANLTADNITGFVLERSTDPSFQNNLVTIPLGLVGTYSDPIGRSVTPYFYRIAAANTVGSTVTGFPTMTATSDFSNVVAINPVATPGPLVASALVAGGVQIVFMDNAINETGFVVERATAVPGQAAGSFVELTTLPPRSNTGSVSYIDTVAVAGATNIYRVKAVAGLVSSGYSNTASAAVAALPAAPSNVVVTAVAANTTATLTVTWTDNATNESSYLLQIATNPGFTTPVVSQTLAANTVTFSFTKAARATAYYVRVQAINSGGPSAFVNASPFPITTP